MPDYRVDLAELEQYLGDPSVTGIVKMPATFSPGPVLAVERPY
jgi:hypothetical protein